MDLSTHIVLTTRLLDACGLDRGGAIYAVVPELDVKPAHYHRMFSNILQYQPIIIDTCMDIFSRPEVMARDFDGLRKSLEPDIGELLEKYESLRSDDSASRQDINAAFNNHYCYDRIADSIDAFFDELDTVAELIGPEALKISTDRVTATVGLLSHTYFVTYTYPPMPFIPHSPMAAQQIEFAEAIDYFAFKGIFFESASPALTKLREDFFYDEGMWSRVLPDDTTSDPVIRERIAAADGQLYNPISLVKAMIERLGALAPGIEYDAVQKGIRNYLSYLGVEEHVHSDRERLFCCNIEKGIQRIAVQTTS